MLTVNFAKGRSQHSTWVEPDTGHIPGGISFGSVTDCTTLCVPFSTGHWMLALALRLEEPEPLFIHDKGGNLRLFTNIELLLENLDGTSLDNDVRICTVLYSMVV